MAEISGNGTAPRQGAPVESARALSGALVLEDGTVLRGRGLGATGVAVGEVCFVTAMSGYQETLTDPSFAGQIITFTFPHIGIVGANAKKQRSTRSRTYRKKSTRSAPANARARSRCPVPVDSDSLPVPPVHPHGPLACPRRLHPPRF